MARSALATKLHNYIANASSCNRRSNVSCQGATNFASRPRGRFLGSGPAEGNLHKNSEYRNFSLTFLKIRIINSPVPPHQKGRHAIVTFAGRDAVDASGATDERAILRTAKPCGSGAPLQASSPQDANASRG